MKPKKWSACLCNTDVYVFSIPKSLFFADFVCVRNVIWHQVIEHSAGFQHTHTKTQQSNKGLFAYAGECVCLNGNTLAMNAKVVLIITCACTACMCVCVSFYVCGNVFLWLAITSTICAKANPNSSDEWTEKQISAKPSAKGRREKRQNPAPWSI